MKKNLGTADKTIRILAALAFGVLILTNTVTGGLAWLLGVVGVVLILTSLVSFCPLYAALKITTRTPSVSPSK